jgi:hypothetical protein
VIRARIKGAKLDSNSYFPDENLLGKAHAVQGFYALSLIRAWPQWHYLKPKRQQSCTPAGPAIGL